MQWTIHKLLSTNNYYLLNNQLPEITMSKAIIKAANKLLTNLIYRTA